MSPYALRYPYFATASVLIGTDLRGRPVTPARHLPPARRESRADQCGGNLRLTYDARVLQPHRPFRLQSVPLPPQQKSEQLAVPLRNELSPRLRRPSKSGAAIRERLPDSSDPEQTAPNRRDQNKNAVLRQRRSSNRTERSGP